MLYTVTGNCNKCGKCCLPPVMGNPKMLDPKTGICWFYDPKIDYPFGHCRLKGAIKGENYEKVLLRKNDSEFGYCTQKMWDYYLSECDPYPIYTSEELNRWGDSFKLPIECDFEIVRSK